MDEVQEVARAVVLVAEDADVVTVMEKDMKVMDMVS